MYINQTRYKFEFKTNMRHKNARVRLKIPTVKPVPLMFLTYSDNIIPPPIAFVYSSPVVTQ